MILYDIEKLNQLARIEELELTTNSNVYRKRNFYYLGCPICGPNNGCNRKNRWKHMANWKLYRKTQYKNAPMT